MHDQEQELWNELAEKKDMTEEITKKVEAAIKEFQAQYAHGAAKENKPTREPVAV
jgi:hypothetical protein